MVSLFLSIGSLVLSRVVGISAEWSVFVAILTFVISVLGLGFGEWLISLFVAVLARFWGAMGGSYYY